jgi:hypothetical protein
MRVTFAIFKKLPKSNNRPLDENSPNLVTLIMALPTGLPDGIFSNQKSQFG